MPSVLARLLAAYNRLQEDRSRYNRAYFGSFGFGDKRHPSDWNQSVTSRDCLTFIVDDGDDTLRQLAQSGSAVCVEQLDLETLVPLGFLDEHKRRGRI